jgi:hypothetical protein
MQSPITYIESGFKEGDDVAYIPYHAHGNLRHPDVEFGKITSKKLLPDEEIIFVRFGCMANSQGCNPDQLRKVI